VPSPDAFKSEGLLRRSPGGPSCQLPAHTLPSPGASPQTAGRDRRPARGTARGTRGSAPRRGAPFPRLPGCPSWSGSSSPPAWWGSWWFSGRSSAAWVNKRVLTGRRQRSNQHGFGPTRSRDRRWSAKRNRIGESAWGPYPLPSWPDRRHCSGQTAESSGPEGDLPCGVVCVERVHGSCPCPGPSRSVFLTCSRSPARGARKVRPGRAVASTMAEDLQSASHLRRCLPCRR
jgi:hypothetical protein